MARRRQASPWVTAGRSHVDGTPGGGGGDVSTRGWPGGHCWHRKKKKKKKKGGVWVKQGGGRKSLHRAAFPWGSTSSAAPKTQQELNWRTSRTLFPTPRPCSCPSTG